MLNESLIISMDVLPSDYEESLEESTSSLQVSDISQMMLSHGAAAKMNETRAVVRKTLQNDQIKRLNLMEAAMMETGEIVDPSIDLELYVVGSQDTFPESATMALEGEERIDKQLSSRSNALEGVVEEEPGNDLENDVAKEIANHPALERIQKDIQLLAQEKEEVEAFRRRIREGDQELVILLEKPLHVRAATLSRVTIFDDLVFMDSAVEDVHKIRSEKGENVSIQNRLYWALQDSNMDRKATTLLEECKIAISSCVAEYNRNGIVRENMTSSNMLCALLEYILKDGMKVSSDAAQSYHLWDLMVTLPDCLPSTNHVIQEITKSHSSKDARARCFLRLGLNEGALRDYLSALTLYTSASIKMYGDNAIMKKGDFFQDILQQMDTLTHVQFKVDHQDPNLVEHDVWFKFAKAAPTLLGCVQEVESELSSSSAELCPVVESSVPSKGPIPMKKKRRRNKRVIQFENGEQRVVGEASMDEIVSMPKEEIDNMIESAQEMMQVIGEIKPVVPERQDKDIAVPILGKESMKREQREERETGEDMTGKEFMIATEGLDVVELGIGLLDEASFVLNSPPEIADTVTNPFLMKNYEKPVKGMSKRSNVCPQCQGNLSHDLGRGMEVRFCHYTGAYFCSRCHLNERICLPGLVVNKQNPETYPVSHWAFKLIRDKMDEPVIDLAKENSKFARSQMLMEVVTLRQRLKLMYEYVSVCPDKQILIALFGGKEYLMTKKDVDVYSLSDLRQTLIRNKKKESSLAFFLRDIVEKIEYHITVSCMRCRGKAHICEICESNQLIYSFTDPKTVYQCGGCTNLFHYNCYKTVQKKKKEKGSGVVNPNAWAHCPTCRRRALRGSQGVSVEQS